MKTKLIALLIGAVLSANAQDLTQIVKGKIIDADTNTPLVGVTVVLLNSDPLQGCMTDLDGTFKLDHVPVGRQSFSISYLGYEEVYRSEVSVASGREVVLNIAMKESFISMDEVKVVAHRNNGEALNVMANISSHQISVESTSRVAAGISDPARTAQSYAGVAAADDEGNELVIRGNSPRGMLWRMEGIEIPNPNHFPNGEGGSGGGVSALSSQVLSNSDFFTSAFPAEYGNALSGVFDLRLRKGNSEKREYALQLGVLGAQVAAEGPFVKGKQASYLINYRYSTLEMLSKMGIDISGGDVVPKFQDLSYKLYFPTRKAGYFSIWGLGGVSSAGSNYLSDSTLWTYRSDRYGYTENHRLMINGITHNYIFKNGKTYIRTVAAYSTTTNSVIEDSLGHKYMKAITQDENLEYGTLSLNSFINHKFNSRHIIRTGLTAHHKTFALYMKDYNYEERVLETLISNSGSTQMMEGYLQWQYRLSEKLELNTGLHGTYMFLNNDFVIEPRLGFTWKANDKNFFNLGAGLHSKAEPLSIYLSEHEVADGTISTPNMDLGITKSAHFVAGYHWNFAKDFRLKTEIYYQYLYDVPVKVGDTTGTVSALNFSSGYTNEKLSNQGTGQNYGVELTLEKFFSNNYYLMATGSLFESKYTMPDFEERNTAFNSGYICNLVGGKEFLVGKNNQNVIGANLRVIWRGGYRTIPLNMEESVLQNRDVRDYERAYETKAPDYFRVDVGVSFRKNKPNWSWIVSLDLQNATGRLNVADEFYSPETGNVESWYMNGLIPILNYRIEF
jgi:hypothetical protein